MEGGSEWSARKTKRPGGLRADEDPGRCLSSASVPIPTLHHTAIANLFLAALPVVSEELDRMRQGTGPAREPSSPSLSSPSPPLPPTRSLPVLTAPHTVGLRLASQSFIDHFGTSRTPSIVHPAVSRLHRIPDNPFPHPHPVDVLSDKVTALNLVDAPRTSLVIRTAHPKTRASSYSPPQTDKVPPRGRVARSPQPSALAPVTGSDGRALDLRDLDVGSSTAGLATTPQTVQDDVDGISPSTFAVAPNGPPPSLPPPAHSPQRSISGPTRVTAPIVEDDGMVATISLPVESDGPLLASSSISAHKTSTSEDTPPASPAPNSLPPVSPRPALAQITALSSTLPSSPTATSMLGALLASTSPTSVTPLASLPALTPDSTALSLPSFNDTSPPVPPTPLPLRTPLVSITPSPARSLLIPDKRPAEYDDEGEDGGERARKKHRGSGKEITCGGCER